MQIQKTEKIHKVQYVTDNHYVTRQEKKKEKKSN